MIKIFKGDDTGGMLGKSVVVEITTEYDLSNCSVIFNYQGVERRWTGVQNGDRREVFFSHNETARMSVGTFKAVIIAVDAAGKIRTITNSLPIKVSTNLAECYGDNVAQVTIGATVNWDSITGKPNIITAELFEMLDDLGKKFSLNQVGEKINEIIALLKGG